MARRSDSPEPEEENVRWPFPWNQAGAFVDSPIRQFELTPEGLVSGFLIGASMEGGK